MNGMNQYTVTFLPHNYSVSVPSGTRLIRAALRAGVHINASCGGEGVCGKCRVRIIHGSVENGLSERLHQDDMSAGFRLACKARVIENITIEVPSESALDNENLNLQKIPRKTARINQLQLADLAALNLYVPPVEKVYLELSPPSAQNNMPDVARLIAALKEKAGVRRCEISLPVIKDLPTILRANDFKVTVTVMHSVKEGGKNQITHVQSGDTSKQNFGLAVDIGTTTVFGQLVNLNTGEILHQFGKFNDQISYGEDVISRIIIAEKTTGLKKLQQLAVRCINDVLNEVVLQTRVNPYDISTITLAGNTTMTQLFLGIDPSPIRRAPYVPATTLYPPLSPQDVGLDLADHTKVLLFPNVSSYVGGDIIAGLMGSGMYRRDEITLYLDIGTNAEIVIGNKDWLVCTACSAGPAFEGGGIEFGMRAAKGAIEDFSIHPKTYEPMLITIGNARPAGICGSGLITMTAVLFEAGVINNKGRFNRELNTERIRQSGNIWEYVLAWKDETAINRDITLTELDIENLIRAKGAIYSGCMTLLTEVGLSMDMIEQIILAGGFGSYIDLEKAMTIGLLPELDTDKISFIGNGSLFGATMSGYTNKIRQDVVEVTGKITNFELSETPSYMENYVAAMFLPHTDIEAFPQLKARLEKRKRER